MAAGIPVWFIRDVKRDVVTMRDNHLVHIAKDVSDIKSRVAVLEEKTK